MRETMTDKRRQILDAALALCAEDGLQGAATARIAKAAGVANGTLFHHFPSKEVLIQSLYQDIKLRLGAAITEAGLRLYDAYNRKVRALPDHRFLGTSRLRAEYPGFDPRIIAAGVYHEGQITHAERLGLELVMDGLAAHRGGALDLRDFQEANPGQPFPIAVQIGLVGIRQELAVVADIEDAVFVVVGVVLVIGVPLWRLAEVGCR